MEGSVPCTDQMQMQRMYADASGVRSVLYVDQVAITDFQFSGSHTANYRCD